MLLVVSAQRLALARALARKPKLLVLDEATSALDTETESKLKLVSMGDGGGRALTTLVIAHRLTTVRECDNIGVVKNGKIVAQGSGEEFFAGLERWFFVDDEDEAVFSDD